MGDQYLGEIRLFPQGNPPKGWAPCAGQSMAIQSNQALFSLIGTYYGGDGVRTFQLPDLRGRGVVCTGQATGGSNYVIGQVGGTETVTLTAAQTPAHTHLVMADANTAAANNGYEPQGSTVLGRSVGGDTDGNTTPVSIYGTGTPSGTAGAPTSTVGGQAHENRQPFLGLNYCIALQGIFPSRN